MAFSQATVNPPNDWRYLTNGPYVSPGTTTYPILDDMLAAAGLTSGTIVISDTQTLTTSRTLKPGLTLKIVSPGMVSVPVGQTFTINGDIDAGAYQIFTGVGTVVFGSGSGSGTAHPAYLRWWGATGDGTTDDTAAVQAAFTATQQWGGNFKILGTPGDIYAIDKVTWYPRGSLGGMTGYIKEFDGQGCIFKQRGINDVLSFNSHNIATHVKNIRVLGSHQNVWYTDCLVGAPAAVKFNNSAGTEVASPQLCDTEKDWHFDALGTYGTANRLYFCHVASLASDPRDTYKNQFTGSVGSGTFLASDGSTTYWIYDATGGATWNTTTKRAKILTVAGTEADPIISYGLLTSSVDFANADVIKMYGASGGSFVDLTPTCTAGAPDATKGIYADAIALTGVYRYFVGNGLTSGAVDGSSQVFFDSCDVKYVDTAFFFDYGILNGIKNSYSLYTNYGVKAYSWADTPITGGKSHMLTIEKSHFVGCYNGPAIYVSDASLPYIANSSLEYVRKELVSWKNTSGGSILNCDSEGGSVRDYYDGGAQQLFLFDGSRNCSISNGNYWAAAPDAVQRRSIVRFDNGCSGIAVNNNYFNCNTPLVSMDTTTPSYAISASENLFVNGTIPTDTGDQLGITISNMASTMAGNNSSYLVQNPEVTPISTWSPYVPDGATINPGFFTTQPYATNSGDSLTVSGATASIITDEGYGTLRSLKIVWAAVGNYAQYTAFLRKSLAASLTTYYPVMMFAAKADVYQEVSVTGDGATYPIRIPGDSKWRLYWVVNNTNTSATANADDLRFTLRKGSGNLWVSDFTYVLFSSHGDAMAAMGKWRFPVTQSANLITGSTSFGANWTGIGADWTAASIYAEHVAGNTTALVSSFTPTAGVFYDVFWMPYNRTAGNVTMSMGGVSSPAVADATRYCHMRVKAINTNALTFTPSTTFDGRITRAYVRSVSAPTL